MSGSGTNWSTPVASGLEREVLHIQGLQNPVLTPAEIKKAIQNCYDATPGKVTHPRKTTVVG